MKAFFVICTTQADKCGDILTQYEQGLQNL